MLPLVHEPPADPLYLRHCFMLIAGMAEVQGGARCIHVAARSAGTHAALSLAAHWHALQKGWKWLYKVPSITRLVLCGLAGPAAYWHLAKQTGAEIIAIQALSDLLCRVSCLDEVGQPGHPLNDTGVVRVKAPDPRLDHVVLGPPAHGYMELATCRDFDVPLRELPAEHVVTNFDRAPRSVGMKLGQLLRLVVGEGAKAALENVEWQSLGCWDSDTRVAVAQADAAFSEQLKNGYSELRRLSKAICRRLTIGGATLLFCPAVPHSALLSDA